MEEESRTGLATYRHTKEFPGSERYGFTGEMRKASVLIPSNIAKGPERDPRTEPSRFQQIATGSASKLEYQALRARDLEYLSSDAQGRLIQQEVEVKRVLWGLLQRLRTFEQHSGAM